MTVQELFNDIPLWQVAHILPHEAAQIVADWAARIGNIN